MGRKGVEPLTFRLSVERSTKLSYRPVQFVEIKVIYSCGSFLCKSILYTINKDIFPDAGGRTNSILYPSEKNYKTVDLK